MAPILKNILALGVPSPFVALRWLLNPARLPWLLLLALALALFVQRGRMDDLRADLRAEHAAHIQTRNNVRIAQEQARATALAQIARVRAEEESINAQTVSDYRVQLDAVRARADRLRNAARADAGRPGQAAVPATLDRAAGAAGASPDHRFSGPAGGAAGEPGVTMSLEERRIATEQALQLDALITAVQAQAQIEMEAAHD